MVTLTSRRTSTAEHLASVVKSPDVITAIDPLAGGSLRAKTVTWQSYWQPVQWVNDPAIVRHLDALDGARARYIDSGFDIDKAQRYCFRYFSLLDAVLASDVRDHSHPQWRRVLRMVLAFECFPIQEMSPTRSGRCAGTTTIRNPAYLLSKLRAPYLGDDPKRLPLLTLDEDPPRIYFHYRQYRVVEEDLEFSVLGHLSNERIGRHAALRLAGNVGLALHSSPDPYVHPRATRLWLSVILPLLEGAREHPPSGTPLGMVDVGAGSGRLAAGIANNYVRWSLKNQLDPALRLWFVERSGQDPSALFRDKSLSRYVRNVTILPTDYRSWLGRSRMMPATSRMRIGLVSKVLDVASSFVIRDVEPSMIRSAMGLSGSADDMAHLPSVCLARSGVGPSALVVGNSRISTAEGHLYPQLSLAAYYQGLAILQSDGEAAGPSRVSLPVRVFDPACLTTNTGDSILDQLCRLCTYLLVEDQDTRPDDLVAHLEKFSLKQLRVIDLTSSMRLKDNYSYLIWNKYQRTPSLDGMRLW